MDNIVSVKLDSRYASTLGVWQYDYGQVLRITGPELPPAVEVQFSLDEKSGETLSRVGTTVDGVTEVKIPDELLTHSATSNYRIYVYIYLTDETSGNTKYEITIPVRVRSKPTSPTEDPETDPDLFRETVAAVNASAERAENAASSATESAASAEETLIEIKRVTDGISEDIENANTAKSELSGMINSAEEKKKELESSIGKAGETKTSLDSAISSAGEKQLALDATVEQANTVDASLKEHIGSAEQIQANVEQIGKNTQAISSLNEDLGNKITKFYVSNQGETHLADSDNGKIMDMMLYGRSEQKSTTGAQLANLPNKNNVILDGVSWTSKDNVVTAIGETTKGHASNTITEIFYSIPIIAGNYNLSCETTTRVNVIIRVKRSSGLDAYYTNNSNFSLTGDEKSAIMYFQANEQTSVNGNVKIMLNKGNIALPFEPYTGGIPSPSPEYPQEIKSVVNPIVKVTNEDGTQFETATLPYTLNAIPVSSGGNITINGQQYIADRVVEKDGVFGIERNIREIHTNTKTMNNSEEHPGWNNVEGISDVTYYNKQPVGTSRILIFISNFTQSTLCQNNIKPNNIVFLRRDIIGYSQSELIAKAIDVDMYIRLQDAIFEPLPVDIQAKLRTLVTNYPVTNISVTSDQLDGYTVFNYPISMANGWNYVKQQLGDARDYIYDMDLQSAEAYVNSEYAVALTELEV